MTDFPGRLIFFLSQLFPVVHDGFSFLMM